MTSLADRLRQGDSVIAPGIFDALSARIAECAGFPLAFLSGSAMSYSQLARPDVGLLTLQDVASTLEKICDRVAMPVFVDVDSGFGNALNVHRTVRTLERAGAAGLQIEDQKNTKLPQDVLTRPLVSAQEMVGKIKSSLDARQQRSTLISARTDAVFSEGIEAAIDRAHQYLQAGADLIFIEGLTERDQLVRVRHQFEASVPLVYNCDYGAQEARLSADTLRQIGYQLVLYPGILVRSMATAGAQALTQLTGGSAGHQELADILGAKEFLSRFQLP